jgi:hypothetical protein
LRAERNSENADPAPVVRDVVEFVQRKTRPSLNKVIQVIADAAITLNGRAFGIGPF